MHCATWGRRHETSQRLPSVSALHELVALVVEFVVVVLPTFVELLTLVELDEFTELVTFAELLVSTELAAAAVSMFSAGLQAHSASASTVTRCLIIEGSRVIRGVYSD